MNFKVAYI